MSDQTTMTDHAIIIGYGLPGRAVAEMFDAQRLPYCVIERNAETVRRCVRGGVHIVEGDIRDTNALHSASISSARLIVIAIPDEEASLAGMRLIRQLNPVAKIVVVAQHVSVGMEVKLAGANSVVVAEQVVAKELTRVTQALLNATRPMQ